MRIRRATAPLSALAALALLLTGCSGSDEDATGASEEAEQTSPLSEYLSAVYGGDLSPEEQEKKFAEEQRETEELVARCMQEEGFEYTPTTSSGAFYGGDGTDTLSSATGAYLYGDAGNDTLTGVAGNDTFDGGLGGDEFHGGAGNDKLTGREGDDRLFGEDGDDHITGDRGADRLLGGEGGDTIFGNLDSDVVGGGPGADRINVVAGGIDVVAGGAGNDTVFASATDVVATDCEDVRR